MAEKTVKAPNYTDAQTAQAKADYAAGMTPEAIGAKLGKTARSVIAKLVKEQVYKRKEYTNKSGEKPAKKDEHADALGAIFSLSEGETESLAKANKTALVKMITVIRNIQNQLEMAEAEAEAEAE